MNTKDNVRSLHSYFDPKFIPTDGQGERIRKRLYRLLRVLLKFFPEGMDVRREVLIRQVLRCEAVMMYFEQLRPERVDRAGKEPFAEYFRAVDLQRKAFKDLGVDMEKAKGPETLPPFEILEREKVKA